MRYFVPPDKILKYLLDPKSAAGASKAVFFFSRGFSLQSPDELVAALLRHPVEAKLVKRIPHPEGNKLVFECLMQAADGSRPCIRSVWVEDAGASSCRLVTAYRTASLRKSS